MLYWCGSQSDNEGIHIPAKVSETIKVTWHDLFTKHRNEAHSIAWYAKQFDCSWGTARDNIEGTIDRGGKIVGWVNEPVIEPESEIDPMEQLIQGRLILIEVAISCQGVLTRCKNLTSDFEAGIRALNEVSKVATIQDTN